MVCYWVIYEVIFTFRTKFFVHLSSPPPRLHYHNITRGPIQNTFLLHNVLILEGWWDNDSYGSE